MRRFCMLLLSMLFAAVLCACGRVDTPESYAKAYCGAENVAFDQNGGIWFVSSTLESTNGSVEQYDTLSEFAPISDSAPETVSPIEATLTARPQKGDETIHVCICNLDAAPVSVQVSLQVKLNGSWYMLPGDAGYVSITMGASNSVSVDLPVHDKNPPIPGQYRLVVSDINGNIWNTIQFTITS